MTLRTARRGRNAGNQFWGCSQYRETKCRGIVNLDDGANDQDDKRQPPAQGPRRTQWVDGTARRAGWVAYHATIGGGFRSIPAEKLPDAFCSTITTAFVARTDLPSYQPADDDTVRVVGMVRKLLARGTMPPSDPRVERAVLKRAGLPFGASSLPGDLGVQVNASDLGKVSPRLPATLATAAARPDDDLPYDSEEERQFHQHWVPNALGAQAARWFIPQASLDRLLYAAGRTMLRCSTSAGSTSWSRRPIPPRSSWRSTASSMMTPSTSTRRVRRR